MRLEGSGEVALGARLWHPPAMRPPRKDWPSLASSKAAKLHIGGICGKCSPPRRIEIDIADLIAKYGPDVKTRDAMDRITCSVCGARVPVTLAPDRTGPE